jgi:hypothetical protein
MKKIFALYCIAIGTAATLPAMTTTATSTQKITITVAAPKDAPVPILSSPVPPYGR